MKNKRNWKTNEHQKTGEKTSSDELNSFCRIQL